MDGSPGRLPFILSILLPLLPRAAAAGCAMRGRRLGWGEREHPSAIDKMHGSIEARACLVARLDRLVLFCSRRRRKQSITQTPAAVPYYRTHRANRLDHN